jgi:intracellular sulfur oxidation DsrE/DsrF family protein
MKDVSGRRSFFTALASVAGLAALRPGDAAAQAAPPSAGPFDMAWLEQMKGKHKQLYDLGGISLAEEPRPLRFCRNFLDTFHDVYKLEHPGVNTAVGISGPAFPMNATDRLWEKYKLGERAKIIDPKTKQPSVRNIFYDDGSDISVKAIQARGTIFWQCNVALGGVAQQLADQFKMPFAEVRADLIAGLNPGVKLMPSHVMALALAQEKGFTYMRP